MTLFMIERQFAEKLQRHRHVAGFHARQRVTIQAEPVRTDKRRAQAGTRHQHQH